jgi:Uma2 family endonuclease
MTLIAQRLNLQEFLLLSNIEESPAWELLNGESIQKPMPTLHHSRLQKRLVAAIDQASHTYEAFPELRCQLSQHSVVPDITIVSTDRLPLNNQPIQGAPDWAIEILSPDQRTTKVITKIQICLQEGTHLGWLIDPAEALIMVFWPDRPLAIFSNQEILPTLPDIPLILSAEQIFTWAQTKA